MMKTRIGRRLAMSIMVAAAATAAVPAFAEDITLTFANWAAAETTTRAAIEQVIANFEAENPGIKIDSQAIAFAEMSRQLVLRVRSGNPPDVAELPGTDAAVLDRAGALQPLDSFAADGTLDKLQQGTYKPLISENGLVALPWNAAPAGLWFNRDILAGAGLDPDNPPKTIDELDAAMAKVKAKYPDIVVLGLDTTNRAFALQTQWPWLRAFGAIPFGPGANGANSPEMKAYLSWMRMLGKKGYIDPGRKIGEFRPLIAQGQVAFLWDQVIVQGVIQAASGIDDAAFYKKFGVEAMPAGPSGHGYSFDGGLITGMFAKSEHKEAAWKFMKYLATNESAVKIYTINANSAIPPAKEFKDPELTAMLDTPVLKTYAKDIIPTITSEPFGPDFAKGATAIMAGVQEAITSDRPIDDIAADIQAQLDR